MSKLAYIQFLSEDDAARGFQILRQKFEIAIEENVYCVPIESLAALDCGSVCYTMADFHAFAPANRRGWRILAASAAV